MGTMPALTFGDSKHPVFPYLYDEPHVCYGQDDDTGHARPSFPPVESDVPPVTSVHPLSTVNATPGIALSEASSTALLPTVPSVPAAPRPSVLSVPFQSHASTPTGRVMSTFSSSGVPYTALRHLRDHLIRCNAEYASLKDRFFALEIDIALLSGEVQS